MYKYVSPLGHIFKNQGIDIKTIHKSIKIIFSPSNKFFFLFNGMSCSLIYRLLVAIYTLTSAQTVLVCQVFKKPKTETQCMPDESTLSFGSEV